jgi:hypothetical protein
VIAGRDALHLNEQEALMTDISTTVDNWFAALNEPDPGDRRAHIEQAWSPDGQWVDPPFEGQGHDALNQMIDGVHAQYPKAQFQRTSAVDSHHDAVRYRWELVGEDGNVIVAGLDAGQLAADGRLQRVTGFFGEPAEAAAA